MIGEREEYTSPDTNYGMLNMRSYNIDGNQISAFYDSSDKLVFVLDNTLNQQKPNVLLVINPDANKKWDEILANEYDVDLETVRPKIDNKYQKLDIEYSGLNVYDNLIKAFVSGHDITEELNQLSILRDSAMRHSAMMRLNVANDIISKTNATIVKTNESIVRYQERIKTLRARLSATKKEIGRVPTKQSASKVLKIESQIDATNEKLKRAKKRLESAQKRLETATVDAELASQLLNQPSMEIKQVIKNNPVVVPQKNEVQVMKTPALETLDDDDDKEEDDVIVDDIDDVNADNDVKPLFNQDPQILNEEIAFKPISFDTDITTKSESEDLPMVTEVLQKTDVVVPESEPEVPVVQQNFEPEEKSSSDLVIENIPVPDFSDDDTKDDFVPEPVSEPVPEPVSERAVLDTITSVEPMQDAEPEPAILSEPQDRPVPTVVAPIVMSSDNRPEPPFVNDMSNNSEVSVQYTKSKPSFAYYLLLIILIVLSVLTLWTYQRHIKNATPILEPKVEAQSSEKTAKPTILKKHTKANKDAAKPAKVAVAETEEPVFLDEKPTVSTENTQPVDNVVSESVNTDVAPVVINNLHNSVNLSGTESEIVNDNVADEDEVLAAKPVYEPGVKHDEMFVIENPEPEMVETPVQTTEYQEPGFVEYTDTEIQMPEQELQPGAEPEYSDVPQEDAFYDEEEAQYQAERESYIE